MTVPRVVRSRTIDAPAEQVWAVLGDLSRHGELIPATRVDAPARTTRPGDRITAVSAGLFVDRMVTESVRATPPGAPWGRWATLRKVGPILAGTAHVAVVACGATASTVVWAEDVSVRGLTAGARRPRGAGAILDVVAGPFLDVGLALMSDLALARLSALARRGRAALPST